MRGFVTDPQGRAGLLLVDDLPEPRPAAGELLMAVRAFSINAGEARLVETRPNRWRPGQDVAGVVVRAAADGSGPPEGARVAARIDWEGWAEYAVVPVSRAAQFDDRVSFEQAATLPVAGLTALRALWQGGAVLGRRVLVTGATGGVGQFAVQLAALAGAHVTARVSAADRADEARELGAHEVVTSLDDAGPFHLVLDGVGGVELTEALHRTAAEGTVVLYGGPGGAAEVRLGDFYRSAWNGRLIGLISDAPEATLGTDLAVLTGLVADGRLRPRIGWHRDWSETPQAFEALAKREVRGKAVLTVR